MAIWQPVPVALQLAAHLRSEIEQGRWRGPMPGVIRLATELGVARNTAEAALRELVRQGVLLPQGGGRGRLIAQVPGSRTAPLRVAILLFGVADRRVEYVVELRHLLAEAGHLPFFASKSLTQLQMDVKKIANFVNRIEADAWVVLAASREVLEWFAARPTPAFALFGNMGQVPIAGTGPDKQNAYTAVVRKLTAQGHRRIVLLARPQRKLPSPGLTEMAFLTALEAAGIAVSDYNFPLWVNTKEGFHQMLQSLFQVTRPTALVVQEVLLFTAARQFVARRKLRVPEDLSLVCADPDPAFEWQIPAISHISWDSGPWVRHILNWVNHLRLGQCDRRQILPRAEFVPGGTIGPVPKD